MNLYFLVFLLFYLNKYDMIGYVGYQQLKMYIQLVKCCLLFNFIHFEFQYKNSVFSSYTCTLIVVSCLSA